MKKKAMKKKAPKEKAVTKEKATTEKAATKKAVKSDLDAAAALAGLNVSHTRTGAVLWSYGGEPVFRWEGGRWASVLRPREGKGNVWSAYSQACLETTRALEAGRLTRIPIRRWANQR